MTCKLPEQMINLKISRAYGEQLFVACRVHCLPTERDGYIIKSVNSIGKLCIFHFLVVPQEILSALSFSPCISSSAAHN